jgi:lactoylglutathione lyase
MVSRRLVRDVAVAQEGCVKIEHIAIWCEDLEGMQRFYENYFGARSGEKYVNRAKRFESCFLSFASGARLELMRSDAIPTRDVDQPDQTTGLVHLAFAVGSKERVDTLTECLAQAGHEVVDGPRTTGDGYYESVVLDPERNRVEITV